MVSSKTFLNRAPFLLIRFLPCGKSMNIQRRTARVSIRLLRCLILWGYDRSRHENITYGGIFYVRKRVQHSGEHGFDVVAFRIMHESGIIGRAVVRARAGFAVVSVPPLARPAS